MAKFYVGQRVRVVRCESHPQIAGCEATIVRRGDCSPLHWALDVAGIGRYGPSITFGRCHLSAYDHELAPLTDPKADEFVERIKKIAREPQGTVVKERV